MNVRVRLSSAAVVAVLAGCSSSGGDEPSSQTASVTVAEVELATKAVALIAGSQEHCNHCHTASKNDIRRWGNAMKVIETTCLAPALNLTAEQRVACLSDHPDDAASGFSARKLGLYSGALKLPAFRALVSDDAKYADLQKAAMPKTGTALTEAQFKTIKKWVLAGMPALDDVMNDPDLGPCQTSVLPEMGEHIARMKSDGWGARLAAASTPMFGCGAATTDPSLCLTSLPDVTAALGQPGTRQTLRKLRVVGSTDFWVRSSADGRFTGVGGGGRIFDHKKGPTARAIPVDAPYDPTFLPNNDGFGFAGTNGGITLCRQGVLDRAAGQTNPRITLRENGCNGITDSVYQSVGASLDNSIFWLSTGMHVNDFGEAQPPPEGFDSKAVTTLTPMVSDGVKFVAQHDVDVALPYEGDQVLSPSSQLVVTRFGNTAGKRGFRVRRLSWTAKGGGNFDAKTDAIATVCLNGAKPVVSFDERFVVTHQYVDAAEHTGLPAKTANIFLMDLATGRVVQVTKVKAKQLALFPHFRADGWLYFLLKDASNDTETLIASDAAVQLAAAP